MAKSLVGAQLKFTSETYIDMSITNWRDWTADSNHVSFGPAKKNNYGSLNMNLKYNGERLYLRTPRMRCPFGLQKGYDEKGFNVQLCFDDKDPDCLAFLEKCKNFDDLVREAGRKNAFDWKIAKTADQVVSDDVLNMMFKPMVRYPHYKEGHEKGGQVNPDYPPYLQISLLESTPKEGDVYPAGHENAGQPREPEILTELYDAKQQALVVDEESIPKQCHLTSLIYATSAYKSTTGFGVVWRAAQFMVFPRQGLEMGKCHIPDEDFENEDMSATVPSFGASATAVEPPAEVPTSVSAPAAAAAGTSSTPVAAAAASSPVAAASKPTVVVAKK
jgi:hypothetical protein